MLSATKPRIKLMNSYYIQFEHEILEFYTCNFMFYAYNIYIYIYIYN